MAEEGRTFVTALKAGVEQGWYQRYQVMVSEPRTWETAAGPAPGYLVTAVLVRDGAPHVSFMHIVTLGGEYVKTRLTLPAEQWETSLAPSFPLDLFRLLPGVSAPAP